MKSVLLSFVLTVLTALFIIGMLALWAMPALTI